MGKTLLPGRFRCGFVICSVGLLVSSCAVEFEPEITPVVWVFDESEGRFSQVEPEQTIDPTNLEIPETGSREELLYYAELLGFGKDGRPSIDQYFDPYFTQSSLTGGTLHEPTPGLLAAAESFYGSEAQLADIARNSIDNPINYWEADPITTLTGDSRRDMAFFMSSGYNKHHMALFLDAIGADRTLYWNYEPAWLAEMMIQNPNALIQAQFQLLQMYAENPEVWEWIQTADPIGPTD